MLKQKIKTELHYAAARPSPFVIRHSSFVIRHSILAVSPYPSTSQHVPAYSSLFAGGYTRPPRPEFNLPPAHFRIP